MKFYSIIFYTKGRVRAMYSRQFESKAWAVDWALAVQEELHADSYEITSITESEYLAAADEEMKTKH